MFNKKSAAQKELFSWKPIISPESALNLKFQSSKWLVGIGLFQCVVGIGVCTVGFLLQTRFLLELGITIFFSSFLYGLSGSLLYKFQSRLVAVAIVIFSAWNLYFAYVNGGRVYHLILYILILWICLRGAYSIFLLYEKWPAHIRSRLHFPKWFFVLYVLLPISLVALAILIIFRIVTVPAPSL